MTENEKALINIIRSSDEPEKAVMIFVAIIELLKHHEASEEQIFAHLQTNYRTSP